MYVWSNFSNLLIFISQDVVIVCFSLNNQDCFDNAESIWYQEAKVLSPGSPIILVGTKKDLSQDRHRSVPYWAHYYLETTADVLYTDCKGKFDKKITKTEILMLCSEKGLKKRKLHTFYKKAERTTIPNRVKY